MQIDRLQPNEVRLLLRSQKSTFAQVSPTLGPHGAVKLSQSVAHLLNVLGQYFDEYLDSIKSSPTQDLESKTASLVFAKYLGIVHNQYFRFLVPADPYSFPGELLHPLKDFLIKFGGYEKNRTSFGLFHWHSYNYSVARLPNPLELITREIENALSIKRPRNVKAQIKKLPDSLVFITYPQAEGRNIFLHGLLFHELGHAIDWKRGISEPVLKIIKWTSTSTALPDIFRKWVREIVADLVAIRLVGPSMLFSSRLAALTMNVMDQDYESHPSSRFRVLWMLEHLERMGYTKPNVAVKSPTIIQDWYTKSVSASLPSTTPDFDSVRSILRERAVIKALHESVEQRLAYGYSADNFGAYVPDVVANFKEHLPHTGERVDFAIHTASVLNAAWENRLTQRFDEVKESNLCKEHEILCGLALKSIEANYIQRLWDNK